jgi:hypothetical protein
MSDLCHSRSMPVIDNCIDVPLFRILEVLKYYNQKIKNSCFLSNIVKHLLFKLIKKKKKCHIEFYEFSMRKLILQMASQFTQKNIFGIDTYFARFIR